MLSARELKKPKSLLLNVDVKVNHKTVILLTYCYYYIWENTIKFLVTSTMHTEFQVQSGL